MPDFRKVFGFTGTQQGMTPTQRMCTAILLSQARELHHGDCIGADFDAHRIAIGLARVVVHPPINPTKRAWCEGANEVLSAKPYLERNRDIVDACDILIAAPRTLIEEQRSGTWATIRYARLARRKIYIVHDALPNGYMVDHA